MAPQEYWDPVIPHVSEHDAIVPQRPGFGTCLDDPTTTSADEVLEREIEYVQALIENIDGNPVLFGHSFGGLTAIEAARVVDVDAVVAYEPAILPDGFREQADLAERMATLLKEGEREEAVKRYIEQVLHPEGIDDLDAWLSEWPVWPDCVGLAEEVLRMNRAVEQYRLPDQFDIGAPALVLTGTDGPDFLRESARSVHEALPHSRFVEFDGVGHGGPAEAPERIAPAVKSFLQQKR
ncbi:hydrolase [Natrialba chahannaoensis JCM 10990]|uniref:Hydrolase n=2 Tax=Natrialba chahannaoensis TaxID=68911 RepID=M0B546_9EURY|nr:hydrolase [Natrialba chahannaoensis JCM 10990]